jgi:hypothetical protein
VGAAICLVTYAVVVVVHQLSPAIVLGQAVALVVVLRMRHAWLPLAFAVVEGLWLWQAWGYLGGHFQLVSTGGISNVRPPTADPVLPYAQVLAWGSPLLMGLVGALTLTAVLRLLPRPDQRWVLAPVVLGLVPVVTVFVQSYGNEAVFRAYLFALPWSAVLVSRTMLLSTARLKPGLGWLPLVVPPLIVLLWMPPAWGAELDKYVFPSDVRTAQWAGENLPADAGYLTYTAGMPLPMTGDYAGHRFTWELLNQSLTEWPDYSTFAARGAGSLAAYAATAASWYPVRDVYLFLGPGQRAHVAYYDDLGGTDWDALRTAVAAHPSWVLVRTDGDSTVWHYTGTTAAPSPQS